MRNCNHISNITKKESPVLEIKGSPSYISPIFSFTIKFVWYTTDFFGNLTAQIKSPFAVGDTLSLLLCPSPQIDRCMEIRRKRKEQANIHNI